MTAPAISKETNDNRRKQNKHQHQARCYPLFFIKGALFIPDNRQRQDQKKRKKNKCITIYPIDNPGALR